MPHNMADNRAYEPSFAEKRLHLVSRAVKCLSDSVNNQELSEYKAVNVSQSNESMARSISEYQTTQEPIFNSSRTIKFDSKSPPIITVNHYADNQVRSSIISKIKSLFISQPVGDNDPNNIAG
jgi:hypothetical protein